MNRYTAIQTASGVFFDIVNPRPEDVRIEDIAASLAKQCRFTGHTSSFYSVAQHSVGVCDLLLEQGYPEAVQLWGLLHDASEAYLVDLPTPIKRHTHLGEIYCTVEDNVMSVICEKFGMCWHMPWPVKKADLRLLATEARDLMPDWSWCEETPLPAKIEPWSSDAAESIFLLRFATLFGGANV